MAARREKELPEALKILLRRRLEEQPRAGCRWRLRYLGAVALASGLTLSAAYRAANFRLTAEPHEARVASVTRERVAAVIGHREAYVTRVEIPDGRGATALRELLPHDSEPTRQAGERVRVLCDPSAASQCRPDTFRGVWYVPALLSVLTALFVFVGFASSRPRARREELRGAVGEWRELPPGWLPLCADYGEAGARLKASIDELVRAVNPDPTAAFAIHEQHEGRLSLSNDRYDECRGQLHLQYLEMKKAVKAWRSFVRTLEGEGDGALPPGVSRALPVPATAREIIDFYGSLLSRLVAFGSAKSEALRDSPVGFSHERVYQIFGRYAHPRRGGGR